MVQNWYKGLWELLAFAMQMCLIIITGSAVAKAPIAKKGIRKLAGIAKSGKTTIEMIELESEAVDGMPENPSVGDRLNHSRILAYALALMGVVYIIYYFATKGFDLDINMVNAIFLFAGIIMHGNIVNYIRAVKNGIGGVSGIVFQFPLYAGIMGMIKYSGLVDILATGS